MAGSPGSWSLKFPVYQIDFTAAAAGKRVAATKRKIRWRFGFPNKKALDDGLTGTDCRGEEHEINVVWSLTSGKRQVTMDGREVHYSSSRQGILDFSFTTRGNHVIKVICHAAPPLSATPGFRQYDLYIDGQSFFTMPKMYELGVKSTNPYNRVPGYTGANNYSYSNPTSPISMGSGMASGSQGRSYASNDYSQPASREQEEADLQKAIQASIEESRRHLELKGGDGTMTPYAASRDTGDLLDFGGDAGTAPYGQPNGDARSVGSTPSYYSAPTTYNQHPPAYNAAQYQSPPPQQPPGAGTGALVPSHGPPGYYHAPPPGANQFATPPPVPPAPAPTPAYASAPVSAPVFASAPAYGTAPAPAYAPAPARGYNAQELFSTPSQQSNDVFGLNSPPEDDPFIPKAPPPPTYKDFATSIMGAYTSPSSAGSAPQTPASGTQNGHGQSPQTPQANGQSPVARMSMHALTSTEEEAPQNSFDSYLKKLVNVDRIDEPAEGEVKLTMMKKEEEKKAKKGHSKPLPPVTAGMVGQNATLSEIKSVKPNGGTLKNDTEGKIMRAPPPGLFQPGAVQSGALVVHGQGPPPLQQPMGFGVGARLPNGGLQNQQQSPYYMQQQQQHAQYR